MGIMEKETKIRIIVTIIATVIVMTSTIIYAFISQTEKDYSYLEEFPSSQTLILNDEVKVENIGEIYYSYDSNSVNNINIQINGLFNGGEFIFSYHNMRLNFSYVIEVVELGNAYNDQEHTASIVRIVSTDEKITGSLLVELKTKDMLEQSRAISKYTFAIHIFIPACLVLALILVAIFEMVDFFSFRKFIREHDKGKEYIREIELEKERQRNIIYEKFNPDLEGNEVYKEFLNGDLGKVFKNDVVNVQQSQEKDDSNEKDTKNRSVISRWFSVEVFFRILGWFLAIAGITLAVALLILGINAGVAIYALIPLGVGLLGAVLAIGITLLYQTVQEKRRK